MYSLQGPSAASINGEGQSGLAGASGLADGSVAADPQNCEGAASLAGDAVALGSAQSLTLGSFPEPAMALGRGSLALRIPMEAAVGTTAATGMTALLVTLNNNGWLSWSQGMPTAVTDKTLARHVLWRA